MVVAWSIKFYLGLAEIMYMCDGTIETVECIWVNIWCMLDCIWSQNCGNALLLYKAGQLVRSSKNGTLFVYLTRIRHRPNGAVSDVKAGISVGAGCIRY